MSTTFRPGSSLIDRIVAARQPARRQVQTFRLPDGKLIQSDLDLHLPIASVGDLINAPKVRQAAPNADVGSTAGDLFSSFAQGAIGGIKSLTDIAGADNAVSSNLGAAADYWRQRVSPERQAELDLQAREKAALGPDASLLDRAGLFARQAVRNPGTTLAEGVGNVVPLMALGPLGEVLGVGAGATAIGTGAAMGIGAVKGGIYDTTYQGLVEQGVPEAEARQRASQAQSYAENPGLIAAGAVEGAVAAKFGADEAIASMVNVPKALMRKELAAEAQKATILGALKGAAKEFATEGPQESLETRLGNEGAIRAGVNMDPNQGVLESGVRAAIMSAVPGALGHVASGRNAAANLAALDAEEAAGRPAASAAAAPTTTAGAGGRTVADLFERALSGRRDGDVQAVPGRTKEPLALPPGTYEMPGPRVFSMPGTRQMAEADPQEEAILRDVMLREDIPGLDRIAARASQEAEPEPTSVMDLLRMGTPRQRQAAAEAARAAAEAQAEAEARAAAEARQRLTAPERQATPGGPIITPPVIEKRDAQVPIKLSAVDAVRDPRVQAIFKQAGPEAAAKALVDSGLMVSRTQAIKAARILAGAEALGDVARRAGTAQDGEWSRPKEPLALPEARLEPQNESDVGSPVAAPAGPAVVPPKPPRQKKAASSAQAEVVAPPEPPATASSPERDALIERIVKKAESQRPENTIVENYELKGSDGKWYRGDFPRGVDYAGERRLYGFGERTKDGVGVGKVHPTRDAAESTQRQRRESSNEEFRQALREMPEEQLQSQAEYWLKQPAKATTTEEARQNAAEKKAPAGALAVDQAAAQAEKPTEAQADAGNYKKGHVRLGGLDISIENEAGSKRRSEWPALNAHYGYVKGTEGKDGDHLDVFIKPGTPSDYSGPVFVVNQTNAKGGFDEHKAMIGWPSEAAALAAYKENYTAGWNRFTGAGDFADMGEFKRWIENANLTKPAPLSYESRKRGAEGKAASTGKKPKETVAKQPAASPVSSAAAAPSEPSESPRPASNALDRETNAAINRILEQPPTRQWTADELRSQLEKSERALAESEADVAKTDALVARARRGTNRHQELSEELRRRQRAASEAAAQARRFKRAVRAVEGDPAQRLIAASGTYDNVPRAKMLELVSEEFDRNPAAADLSAEDKKRLAEGLASGERSYAWWGAINDKGLSATVASYIRADAVDAAIAEAVKKIETMDGLNYQTGYGESGRRGHLLDVKDARSVADVEAALAKAEAANKVGLERKRAQELKDAEEAKARDAEADILRRPLPAETVKEVESLSEGEYNALALPEIANEKGIRDEGPPVVLGASEATMTRLRKRGAVEPDSYALTEEGKRLAESVTLYRKRLAFGIPIEQRTPVKGRFFDATEAREALYTGQHEGRDFYSNGHWLVEGKAPTKRGGTPIELKANVYSFGKILEGKDAKGQDKDSGPEVRPVAFYQSKDKDVVALSNGGSFLAQYVDFITTLHPGAKMFSVGPEDPVYFKAKNRVVAVLMPMRMDLPQGAQEIVDRASAVSAPEPEPVSVAPATRKPKAARPPKERYAVEEVPQSQRDLILQHNLTAANLIHADKMGGLAVPSMAVAKHDLPLEGFGEITLLGDRSLADPKESGMQVYGGDIYSPRYPTVNYKVTKPAAVDAVLKDSNKAIGYSDWHDEVERGGKDALWKNPNVAWTFLKSKGITPDVRLDQPNADRIKALRSVAGLERFFGRPVWTNIEDPEFRRLALQTTKLASEFATEEELKIAADEKWTEDQQQNIARHVAWEVADIGTGKVHRGLTGDALREQIEKNGLSSEYDSFVSSLFSKSGAESRIFQGFTYSGRKRLIPHTLENVVKILKKDMKAGEGFSYGPGTVRGAVTPRFASLEKIRAAKDRLVSKEDMQAVKEEIGNEFWKVAELIPTGGGIGSGDRAVNFMVDVAKRGMYRAMREWNIKLDASEQRKIGAFLEKLKSAPTEYFEAKLPRAVQLQEFKAAVVPDDVDPKALAVLERRGLDIVRYKKGDSADRRRAISEATARPGMRFAVDAAPAFFSQLSRAAQALRGPMPATDALAILKKSPGVKADEMKWTGLDDFLGQKGRGKVTPAEVQEFLRTHQVTVKEVTLGGGRTVDEIEAEMDALDEDGISIEEWARRTRELAEERRTRFRSSDPKFSQYQLPGGTSYREVLLTLPSKQAPFGIFDRSNRLMASERFSSREEGVEWLSRVVPSNQRSDYVVKPIGVDKSFRSSHFNEPNILAHVRMNDRVVDGKRVLFVEEIQSDYGQAARRRGVAHPPTPEQARRGAELEAISLERDFTSAEQSEWDALRPIIDKNMGGVPPAPFVERTEDWTALALKTILHKAAVEGYDAVSWTTGDQQADRYDLSKQISRVYFDDNSSGGAYKANLDGEPSEGTLRAFDLSGKEILSERVQPGDVERHIGKEAAKKLFEQAPKHASSGGLGVRRRELAGLDLKVGGEGMRAFYDRIVPQVAEKIAKKWGVKVGTMDLPGRGRVEGVYEPSPVRVHSLPITPQMRESVASEGFPLFAKGEATPADARVSNPLSIEQVRRAIPGLNWKPDSESGGFVAQLRDGRAVRVQPNATFEMIDDSALIESASANPAPGGTGRPRGSYRPMGAAQDALIKIASGAKLTTLDHEGLHMLWDLALTDTEKAALLKKFGGEEQAAYAYEQWVSRPTQDTWWGRLFEKVRDLARRIVHYFRPTWESTFAEARSGRAGARVSGEGTTTGERAATQESSPPGDPRREANFRRWFGDSKVVHPKFWWNADDPKAGTPRVMYHGTTADFSVFKPGNGADGTISWAERRPNTLHGQGMWFTGRGGADDYAMNRRGDARVVPVYLSIQNPKRMSWREAQDYTVDDLMRQGFDGAEMVDTGDFVAFRPEQIKSAIGNDGNFDPNNPDIRYATDEGATEEGEPDETPQFSAPEETFVQRIERLIRNRLNRVGVVQSAYEAQSGKKSDVDMEDAFAGIQPRAAATVENAEAALVKPLMKFIADRKLDFDLLGRFAMAVHAPDADKAIINEALIEAAIKKLQKDGEDGSDLEAWAEFSTSKTVGVKTAEKVLGSKAARIRERMGNPSGMGPERIAEIMAAVDASGKRPAYEEARQRILDIQSATNNLRVEAGLSSPETVARWREKYGDNFVHLWNDDAEFVDRFHRKGGKGYGVRGAEVRRRRGRKSEAAAHPLIAAFQDMEFTILRASRETALQSFADWVADNPDIGTVREGDPDKDGVGFKRDGKQFSIDLADPLLRQQLQQLTTPQIDVLTQTLGSFTRLFSRINTVFSPPFLIKNPIRDYANAVLSSLILHGAKGGPDGAIAAKVAAGQGAALKGVFRYMKDPTAAHPADSWEATVAEALKHGAIPGYFDAIESMAAIRSKLEAAIKDGMSKSDAFRLGMEQARAAWSDPNKSFASRAATASSFAWDSAMRRIGARAAFDMLMDANKGAEIATRVNYFRALRDSGMTAPEAAAKARNLTDFNKRGEYTTIANAVWSFFNANVQGTARLAEMVTSKDPAVKARAMATMAGLVGAGMLWNAVAGALAGDSDDDGIPDSDQVPDWATERNIVIPAIAGLSPILIPMAQGFNVPFFAGVLLSKALNGSMKKSDAAVALIGAAANSYNPVGTLYGAPTAIQPALEVLGNRDWTGRPVTPTRYPGQEGLPDSQLAFRSTSGLARGVAASLNRLTGGDESVPGYVDVSPATLDHFARYFGGGAGRFIQDSVDAASRMVQGEAPARVPFASSFLIDTNRANEARYWDQVRSLEVLANQMRSKEGVVRRGMLTDINPGADVARLGIADLRKATAGLPIAPERAAWMRQAAVDLDARRIALKPVFESAGKAIARLKAQPPSFERDAQLENIYLRLNRAWSQATGGLR